MAVSIRQEINILDSSIVVGTPVVSGELVQLDTAQYVNPTYYFEVIYTNTIPSGGTQSAQLQDNGSGSSIVDLAVSNSVASKTRLRSSSFSPSAGKTVFRVKANSTGGTGTFTIYAARIIIIDNPTSLTSSETQIEIGNGQTFTATTATALTAPKYWTYNAAKWDGTITFDAEVVWKTASTNTATITLQEDNGSFASWADKITIVNASSTTITRTRTTAHFTPTDGRHYRLAVKSSTTKSNVQIYNAKVIVNQIGTSSTQISNLAGGAANAFIDGGTNAGDLNCAAAQSFTPNSAFTLTKVTVPLKKWNAPAGSLTMVITSSIGGTVLATSTNTVTSSGLTTSYVNTDFNFQNLSLTASTTYYFQVTSSSANDSSNSVSISYASPGAYSGGGRYNYNGTWFTQPTTDLDFSITRISSGPTLFEPQYLLLNKADAGTGLQTFQTYFDADEWAGVDVTYKHAIDSDNASNSAKLVDIDNSNTDVTASAVTGANQQISVGLGFTDNHQIDVNVTNSTGSVNASRILAQVVVDAADLAETLIDNFDDNSTDTTKWISYTVLSATVSETGGEVLATPANSTVSSESGYNSKDYKNLTGSYVKVGIPIVADVTSVYTVLKILRDGNNYCLFGVRPNNTLFALKVIDAVSTDIATTTYDSSVHKYVKIREASDVLYFDYSTDGITYSNLGSTSLPFSINNVQLGFDVYESISDAAPGAGHFDEFNTTISSGSSINVSDSITVSEFTQFNPLSFINKSDTVTVTESVQVFTDILYLLVSDSISVTEATTLVLIALISVSESITVSEALITTLISLVNVNESITVSENAIANLRIEVNKTDSITVSENVNITHCLTINVSDSITVNESTNQTLALQISTSESITITENVAVLENSFINVTESITLSEAMVLLLLSFINTPENITVSENINTTLTHNINVSENITITENVNQILTHLVNVSDSITLSESVSLLETSFINTNDSITVSESSSVSIESLNDLSVNVSESITVSESTKLLLVSFVNTSDSITVTENIKLLLESYVTATENITLSESIKLLEESYISASESITVSENVSILIPTLLISASESITVNESVTELLTSFINTTESITVSENASVGLELGATLSISVSDSISVSESTKLLLQSYVSSSETVNISESESILIPELPVNVSDSITLSESTIEELEVKVNATDSISITENLKLNLESYIYTSENITVSENIELQKDGDLDVNVSENIVVSEAINVAVLLTGTGSPTIVFLEGKPILKINRYFYIYI